MKRDTFAGYHPAVNLTYYVLVLGFCMTVTHPVSQILSFICAFMYAAQIKGRKAVMFGMKFSLPVFLLAAVVTPAFSHAGVTVLFYLPTGNPMTLESILYGLSMGLLLSTVMMWFVSFNEVFTSDKFIYLFGKVIPALSLVLSMTLRFIPKFKEQFNAVSEAQGCIGRDTSKGSVWRRARNAITILSIVVTWALENAIETADSMKSRGYGLKGRTAFSIYRFEDRDWTALIWFVFCGIFLLGGSAAGGMAFNYFPAIAMEEINSMTVGMQVVYFAMCITPVILNRREERQWKALF